MSVQIRAAPTCKKTALSGLRMFTSAKQVEKVVEAVDLEIASSKQECAGQRTGDAHDKT